MAGRMRVTKDDERARRICSLALEFMNSRTPLTSSEVARGFYPDLSPDSFRKSFLRDRAVLAACGLRVVELSRGGGEASWGIDERSSFAEGIELEPRDAAALEISCQALLADPTFPLAEDLRLALAKVARTFADVPALSAPSGVRETPALASIRRALVEGLCIDVAYVDARGTVSRRRLAPYGLFGLRGSLYLVAGAPEEKTPRTYRLDRFAEAEVVEDAPCAVPEGFSVLDWKRLPFQLGPSLQEAVFEVPEGRCDAVCEAAQGQGSFAREGGAVLWTVGACDLDAAASWAISQGIVPVAPAELVGAWEHILKGAIGDES